MAEMGATQNSGPTLPAEPADTTDTVGHAVFHRVLEDIAATDFTGDEQTRVEVLALIDKVAVNHGAELGRTLLRRIDYCALAPPDTLRAQHRVTFIDQGQLHLSFRVYSQLTGYHIGMIAASRDAGGAAPTAGDGVRLGPPQNNSELDRQYGDARRSRTVLA